MTPNNANVFLSSMARTDRRFKYYGTGSIENISLLKMIYKYACYSGDYETLQRLDSIVSILQQIDPDICVNVRNGNFFPEDSPTVGIPATSDNIAPTILGGTIVVDDTTYSSFIIDNFAGSFSDADGDGIGDVVIKTLPANGTLSYLGSAVVANQVIPRAQIGNLIYTRNVNTPYATSFTYAVYDDNQNPKQSNTVSMTVTVNTISTGITVVGDNTIYPENRAITVLTLAMFTTDTVLPYSDTEGDLLHSIRIDEISLDNAGVFTISGTPIVVGDIITRAQIEAGDFVHTGPDQDAINSDVLAFSARDEGSMIWVQ